MNQPENLFRIELAIAKLLRGGVFFAGALMLIGWSLGLFNRHGGFSENPFVTFHDFHAVSMSEQWSNAIQSRNYSIIISYAGLVALISLPILRVFFTMILFFRQREKVLGYIALFVLLALTVSIGLGFEI